MSDLKQSIRRALSNEHLGTALGNFFESYRAGRARAYQGVDFEAVRTRIAERKGAAAAHLNELAVEFARNAEARGATVFRTSDPEEVKRYIAGVAARAGAKTIVKSKSMASEEIHLNPYLEAQGLSVSETDLGEWIIQLAGQRPSHMVMPAIHLTRGEVAGIFSRETGEHIEADIPLMVKLARHELRARFLAADIGITGANIAVAETGSLVLVTNEGNARLVTTLPKTHIAIVGIEKLVEKLADIEPILTALPRSATGQLLTSYVSILTGATPNTDGSPKDLHIILMDSRRSEMARDPRFRQALQCIRCASCLNVCPVYRVVGGHVFGKVYTGGIGAILTAWFDALKSSDDLQSLCIQCGNCAEVCPAKIDIPDLILELRRRITVEQGLPAVQKAAFAVVNNRRLFHSVLRAGSLAQMPFAREGFIRHLPLFLSDLTGFRSLPAIAPEPFRDVFRRISQPAAGERVAFYAGCLIDFAYTEIGEAVVEVLNRAGLRVVFPEGQTCCGAPARYNGAYEVAGQNAVDNIDALLAEDVRWIVSACPTCTVALKHEFAKTLESLGRADQLPRAASLAAKVIDFSTLVKQLVGEGRLTLPLGAASGLLTYHDSCHLKRTLGAHRAPRELLSGAGFEIAEMAEADTCCGMGGSYSLKMPEISAPMLERKLRNAEATGAAVVALDCPGCLMQIRGGFDKRGVPRAVEHTAVLLRAALRKATPE